MKSCYLSSFVFLFLPLFVKCFLPSLSPPRQEIRTIITNQDGQQHFDRSTVSFSQRQRSLKNTALSIGGRQTVQISTEMDDEKIASLFAWVSLAFQGDREYNNLMVAFAAVFGNLPNDSEPMKMLAHAKSVCPKEEELVGEAFSTDEREMNSLGAMGAGQWTGQYRTRPHSLLNIQNLTTVDDWVKTLPRGCKRTIKRALAQNFTVTSQPIIGGQPAPHSSLAHFRCVAQHEVRLITQQGKDPYAFLDALSEATSRYMGTTRMTGEIREYRASDGKVIAIAHEVRKGRTIRGQWFYATDEASKNYVWFHSVYDLVRRAIDCDRIDVVDLGPSGSDAFEDLKERYGFEPVVDWPAVADYEGPFWYENGRKADDRKGMASMAELQMKARGFFY